MKLKIYMIAISIVFIACVALFVVVQSVIPHDQHEVVTQPISSITNRSTSPVTYNRIRAGETMTMLSSSTDDIYD